MKKNQASRSSSASAASVKPTSPKRSRAQRRASSSSSKAADPNTTAKFLPTLTGWRIGALFSPAFGRFGAVEKIRPTPCFFLRLLCGTFQFYSTRPELSIASDTSRNAFTVAVPLPGSRLSLWLSARNYYGLTYVHKPMRYTVSINQSRPRSPGSSPVSVRTSSGCLTSPRNTVSISQSTLRLVAVSRRFGSHNVPDQRA